MMFHSYLRKHGLTLLDDGVNFSLVKAGGVSPSSLTGKLFGSSGLLQGLLGLEEFEFVLSEGIQQAERIPDCDIIQGLVAEAQRHNHSICSSVHIFRWLMRVEPEEVKLVVERVQELYRVQYPLGNEVFQAELVRAKARGEQAEVEAMTAMLAQLPFTYGSAQKLLDNYLNHRLYPYSRTAWREYIEQCRLGKPDPPLASPLQAFRVHRLLGLDNFELP